MVLIKSISVHNALYIMIRKISSLCDILHIKTVLLDSLIQYTWYVYLQNKVSYRYRQ